MNLSRVTRGLQWPSIRTMCSNTTVPLFKATEYGSEEPIKETDLYRYIRYRWLGGEAEKLAKRYREFDLGALLETASKATGGRGRCIKLVKCVEGQYNKAFILSMDTGEELIAKLPNPNAGPDFFTTASEVATRHFLRDCLHVPIPRIHAWSSETSNPVGAEYIIEENASGIPLGQVWSKITKESKFHIIDQIVEIERKFSSVSFAKHGCIYYQADLEQRSQCHVPLDEISIDSALVPGLSVSMSCFALGPLNDPKFWDNKRAIMGLDRGPWDTITQYAMAIGRNELEWASLYAKPRMNFHRSLEDPETPSDYASLLNRYLDVVPCLTSMNMDRRNTISHPDLHLDNIFIDPETNQITNIIDWQRVSVSPALLQRPFPQMLEVTCDEAEQEKELLDYYYNAIKVIDPSRHEASKDPSARAKTIMSLVPCCWDQHNLFFLRNALIEIIALWDDIPGLRKVPCPIKFTEEELLQHQSEMELIEAISGIARQLEDEGPIPLGGMVRPEYYERAKEASSHFKEVFISLAENKRQERLHANVWPYQ